METPERHKRQSIHFNNLTYCYLATGVKLMGEQHLDATEDVEVRIMTRDEVYDLLVSDGIKQALMAAPLWRYFALECGQTATDKTHVC